jgi:hypothetical protein
LLRAPRGSKAGLRLRLKCDGSQGCCRRIVQGCVLRRRLERRHGPQTTHSTHDPRCNHPLPKRSVHQAHCGGGRSGRCRNHRPTVVQVGVLGVAALIKAQTKPQPRVFLPSKPPPKLCPASLLLHPLPPTSREPNNTKTDHQKPQHKALTAAQAPKPRETADQPTAPLATTAARAPPCRSWRPLRDYHYRYELAPARGWVDSVDALFELRSSGFGRNASEGLFVIGHGTRWWVLGAAGFAGGRCRSENAAAMWAGGRCGCAGPQER